MPAVNPHHQEEEEEQDQEQYDEADAWHAINTCMIQLARVQFQAGLDEYWVVMPEDPNQEEEDKLIEDHIQRQVDHILDVLPHAPCVLPPSSHNELIAAAQGYNRSAQSIARLLNAIIVAGGDLVAHGIAGLPVNNPM
jgi:nitroreductase